MFLGEYRHSLDGKGRIILPAKFRDGLEDGCVITKGEDRCLVVYDKQGWERYVAEIRALPTMDRRVRSYARSVFASAHDGTPDKQGRINVPEHLREYAGLKRDVIVTGMDERIEIWDAEAWERISREADGAFPEIAERLAEMQRAERQRKEIGTTI